MGHHASGRGPGDVGWHWYDESDAETDVGGGPVPEIVAASTLSKVVIWSLLGPRHPTRRCRMERVYDRCAGLDVHKKTVTACVRVPGPLGERHQEVRTFGTTATELLVLRD